MREAIHALKYSGLHPVTRVLGQMLAQAIAKLAGEAPARMLVVPVPLHRSKYAQRGFNQARVLAEAALRNLKKTHPSWQLTLAPTTLLRLRPTESQAGLSPRDRRQNVLGAFSVGDNGQVAGKHILLVDDIMTTGSTARAAGLALEQAGAASVWVATLARAQRHSAPDVERIDADGSDADAGKYPDADFGLNFQTGLASGTKLRETGLKETGLGETGQDSNDGN